MRNYIILAAIFVVAFVQYQLGIHGIPWGYTSSFILPVSLLLFKYGLSFYKEIVRVDEEGNLEVDDIFILILLSVCLNLATYHVGLHSEYSKF